MKITWPGIQLQIVGSGTAKNSLRQLIKKLQLQDNVHLLGSKTPVQVKDFLQTLDIFTYTPVYGEAFGLALAEAGLAGLPSVVTAVGGVPEVVLDQKTGLVVVPGDIEMLARSLGYLIENPDKRVKYGSAAKQPVQKHFSEDRMLIEIEKTITSL